MAVRSCLFRLKSSRREPRKRQRKRQRIFKPNKDCLCVLRIEYFFRILLFCFPMNKKERNFYSKNKFIFIYSIHYFLKNWNSKWIFIRKQSQSVLPTQCPLAPIHYRICWLPSSQARNVIICSNSKVRKGDWTNSAVWDILYSGDLVKLSRVTN